MVQNYPYFKTPTFKNNYYKKAIYIEHQNYILSVSSAFHYFKIQTMGKAVKYIPIIQHKFNINLMQQKLTFYQYQSLKNKQTNNTVKCIPIMQ